MRRSPYLIIGLTAAAGLGLGYLLFKSSATINNIISGPPLTVSFNENNSIYSCGTPTQHITQLYYTGLPLQAPSTGFVQSNTVYGGPNVVLTGKVMQVYARAADGDMNFDVLPDPLFKSYLLDANIKGTPEVYPGTIHAEIPLAFQQCSGYPYVPCPDSSWIGRNVIIAGDYVSDFGHCFCTCDGTPTLDQTCSTCGNSVIYGSWSEIHPVRAVYFL